MNATITHGTYSSYQRGCKCVECKAANRDYTRGLRSRLAGTLAADDPRHGTQTGHDNFGCRCRLCRRAHYQALGEYYLRRAAAT